MQQRKRVRWVKAEIAVKGWGLAQKGSERLTGSFRRWNRKGNL